MELVDKILTTTHGKEAFRAYVGYSGWGPGQLESEMKIGSWITVPADPATVFLRKIPLACGPRSSVHWARSFECTPICPSTPPQLNGSCTHQSCKGGDVQLLGPAPSPSNRHQRFNVSVGLQSDQARVAGCIHCGGAYGVLLSRRCRSHWKKRGFGSRAPAPSFLR